MKKTDPKISEWYSELNKKRKTKVGGFSDPEVLKRAIENRIKNNAAKKAVNDADNPTGASTSPEK